MNVERMKLGIATLRRVHATNQPFNIDHWYKFDWDVDDPLTCSTTACALGWISREAWAQEAGITVVDGLPTIIEGKYKHNGFEAGAKLFDIPWEQSHYLFGYFSDDLPITAKDVADRMQIILDTGEVPAKQWPFGPPGTPLD